jgi:hypothetical protein
MVTPYTAPQASFDAEDFTPEASREASPGSIDFDPEPENMILPIKAYDNMLVLLEAQKAEIARLNAEIDTLQSQLRAAV